ncbi:MAG: hypothetical protein K1X64_21615 [Myxococcaceae bacterium]|nr:hypothetical protein [Myxococcaceae bacterium]
MKPYCVAVALLMLALSGCATDPRAARIGLSPGHSVGDAVVMTAIAGTAAVANRAAGNCYAACPNGTTCNTTTGMCDPLPCRGLCAVDEICDASQMIDRCVKRPAASLDIKAVTPKAQAPTAPQETAPTDAPVAPK